MSARMGVLQNDRYSPPGRALPAPWHQIAAILAVAAVLARTPDGRGALPAWVEITVTLAAYAIWLVTLRQSQGMRGISLAIPGLVLTAAAALAIQQSNPRIVGIATTVFFAGSLFIDAIASVYRRFAAVIDHPRELFSVLLRPWLALIVLGGVLLALPLATHSGVPDYRHNFLNHVLDSLFASTSAAALVGTTVHSFGEDYTRFGQAVLFAITQLSGMAFAAAGLSIIRPFLSRSLRLPTILVAAVVLQVIGAAWMTSAWHDSDASSLSTRIWWSLVHAGSAIWNSGLVMRADGLDAYFTDYRVSICMASLTIIGSLGLPILIDLILPQWRKRDGAHSEGGVSKLVRRMRKLPEFEALLAALLLGLGATLLWYFEHPGARTSGFAPSRPMEMSDRVPLNELTSSRRWTLAMLASATLRSAGMNAIPITQGALTWPSFGLILLMMLLGGSAAGVGGGLRTTALALPFALRKLGAADDAARALHRSTRRAICLYVLLGLICSLLSVAALGIVTDATSYETAFDGTAATANVGLSTGLALHLSPAGRIVMIVLFAVGRIGPIYFWLRLSQAIGRSLNNPTN
ncbi:MAG TPA: potassium transporter TrkG [Phycisphaerae bacterium]|nr:potassium transporter TrkG [Phycisphaerae bacterium]